MLEPLPLPPIERLVLANGLTVVVIENPAAPIVAAQVFIRAGSLQEPLGRAGVSHAIAATLTKGTDRLSSRHIAEEVESLGAGLSTDAAADYFVLGLKTIADDFPEMLALAAELLRSPVFPVDELELEKRQTIYAIRSQLEQPFAIAFEQLRQALYGSHPYAVSILGTEASAATLQREDLVAFHDRYFRPDNATIAISGSLDIGRVLALVEATLGDWDIPLLPLPGLDLPRLKSYPARVVTAQESQQAIVMLGYPAAAVRDRSGSPHPDYAALKLASTYLGNGLSSRLFVELREKQGLAYDVSAMYPTRWSTSFFAVYLGTAPDNLPIALASLQGEVDRLSSLHLDPDDLLVSQQKLLGQYALGKQTNGQLAHLLGWYEAMGLGIGFDQAFQRSIAAVTPDDIQAVAHRYLTHPCLSLVGPAAAIASIDSKQHA